MDNNQPQSSATSLWLSVVNNPPLPRPKEGSNPPPWTGVYSGIQPWQTRLIRLHRASIGGLISVDLVTVDLIYFEGAVIRGRIPERDRAVRYAALSYTWGAPEFTEDIVCNGVIVSITKNLYEALQQFQSLEVANARDESFFWADAICIDQSNSAEKEVQVQNILAIYMKAEKVFAWLGCEGRHTSEAVRWLSQYTSWDPWTEVSDTILDGLKDLYEREWFRRVWVQQEMFAARSLYMYCGNIHVEAHLLAVTPFKPDQTPGNYPSKVPARLSSISRLHDQHVSVACHWLGLPMETVFHHSGSRRSKPPQNLIKTLVLTHNLQATIAHDHIFSILGLTDTPSTASKEWAMLDQMILIDYKASIDDVWLNLTVYLINHYPLGFLFTYLGAKSRGPAQYHMPSWVIDWSVIRCSDPFKNKDWDMRLPDNARDAVSLDFSYSDRTLTLTGCIQEAGMDTANSIVWWEGIAFNVPFSKENDVVVWFPFRQGNAHPISSASFFDYYSGSLCLLRPHEEHAINSKCYIIAVLLTFLGAPWWQRSQRGSAAFGTVRLKNHYQVDKSGCISWHQREIDIRDNRLLPSQIPIRRGSIKVFNLV